MNELFDEFFENRRSAFWTIWCIFGLLLLLAACPRAFGQPGPTSVGHLFTGYGSSEHSGSAKVVKALEKVKNVEQGG
ncbi:MAG: hypothetical protein HQM09_02445 [Candidatus Riflebacteria bacterium]|nr:hypothetical protein [Candidatus Riflebacteria bacterium]